MDTKVFHWQALGSLRKLLQVISLLGRGCKLAFISEEPSSYLGQTAPQLVFLFGEGGSLQPKYIQYNSDFVGVELAFLIYLTHHQWDLFGIPFWRNNGGKTVSFAIKHGVCIERDNKGGSLKGLWQRNPGGGLSASELWQPGEESWQIKRKFVIANILANSLRCFMSLSMSSEFSVRLKQHMPRNSSQPLLWLSNR